MRTEATPTSNAEEIMDPISVKRKRLFPSPVPGCAQVGPKICQQYGNVSINLVPGNGCGADLYSNDFA